MVAGQPPLLSHDGVHEARRRLAGRVVDTPVVRSKELEQLAGARLWLKAENLRRGGSFKMRGALLAVERLVATDSPGVVTQSTGNHALAVALAAAQYGLPAVVVLPTDAAPAKVARIQAVGGHLDAVVLPVGAAARWPVPAWPPQAGTSTSTAPSPAPSPL